mgnify:CR=1 FL=1
MNTNVQWFVNIKSRNRRDGEMSNNTNVTYSKDKKLKYKDVLKDWIEIKIEAFKQNFMTKKK